MTAIVSPRTGNDMAVRLACGHMGPLAKSCAECRADGDNPDPWLLAGGDKENEDA